MEQEGSMWGCHRGGSQTAVAAAVPWEVQVRDSPARVNGVPELCFEADE